MWGILFILFFIVCMSISSGIIWIPIVIYLYRKSAKDHKEHPERYKDQKSDNFCYWIDD